MFFFSVEIIYLPSEDEMDVGGWSSEEDVYEEDEDIQKMAYCVENIVVCQVRCRLFEKSSFSPPNREWRSKRLWE